MKKALLFFILFSLSLEQDSNSENNGNIQPNQNVQNGQQAYGNEEENLNNIQINPFGQKQEYWNEKQNQYGQNLQSGNYP